VRNKEGRGRKTKCNVLRYCYSKCYGYLNTDGAKHSHKVCIGYNCLLPGELCGRSEEVLRRSRNWKIKTLGLASEKRIAMQWGMFMGHCSLSEFDSAFTSSSDVLVQEGLMRRRQLWRCALLCQQYN